MKHTRQAAVAVIAVAVLLAAWSIGTVQGQAGARPTRVAVANVEHIFNSLEQRQSLEADIQSREQELEKEANDRRSEIEQLQEDLGVLAADSTAFRQKQEQLERKAVELQAWMQWQTHRAQQERALQTANLYRKLLEAVERVAKQHDFDVVLFKEKAADFANAKHDQIPTLIQVRKVLWADDRLDLTDPIITLMNNEWRNAR